MPPRGERLHLLAAPAEHERVAALEPDDRRAVRREREHHRLDLVLRSGVVPGLLADVQHGGVCGDEVEDLRGDESVVEDDVGGLHEVVRLQREEPGVARAGADEVNLAGARTSRGDRRGRRLRGGPFERGARGVGGGVAAALGQVELEEESSSAGPAADSE